MSNRSASATQSVSLFPFLDVLVCTMGCLILLMLGIIHHGENQVKSGELTLPGKSIPAVVKPLPAPPVAVKAPVAVKTVSPPPVDPKPIEPDFLPAIPSQVTNSGVAHDPELAAEEERLKQLWLDKVAAAASEKDQKAHAAEAARVEAAAALKRLNLVQTELRLTTEQLAALEAQRAELQKSGAGSETEQSKLVQQIAQTQRSLELLKRKQATVSNEFALVPYDGASGTTRRPLYVECTDNGFHILPEDIWIRPKDLEGCSERVNPLLVGMSTLRDYWRTKRKNGDEPEPYLLLVVRPHGTIAYYVARKLLSGFQGPFGYELVDYGTKLSFGETDPAAKAALERSLEQAYALRDERLKELADDLSIGGRRRGTRPLRSSDPESIREILSERARNRSLPRRQTNSVEDISRRSIESSSDSSLPGESDPGLGQQPSPTKSDGSDSPGKFPGDHGGLIASGDKSNKGRAGGKSSKKKIDSGAGSNQREPELGGKSPGGISDDALSPRAASISGRDDGDPPLQEVPSAPQSDSAGSRIPPVNVIPGGGGLPDGVPDPLIRATSHANGTRGSGRRGGPNLSAGNARGSRDVLATNGDPGARASGKDPNSDAAEPTLLPGQGSHSPGSTNGSESSSQAGRSSGDSREQSANQSLTDGQRAGAGEAPGSGDKLPGLDSDSKTSVSDSLPALSDSEDQADTSGTRSKGGDGKSTSDPNQNGFRAPKSPNRSSAGPTLSPQDTRGHSTPYTGEDPQTFSGMAGGAAASPSAGNPSPGVVQLTLPQSEDTSEERRHNDKHGKSWSFSGPRRGIGLQKKIVIQALGDRLLIGPDNYAVPAGQGESQKELLQHVVGAINVSAQEWGAPPANFHWVPAVQFKVYPGGNQHYERLQGALRAHGISSTVDYALDGAPQDRKRGGRR